MSENRGGLSQDDILCETRREMHINVLITDRESSRESM